MAFGGFSDQTHSAPMNEINTTPLVDVMLVLLIIFMLTAPLLTHNIKIDMPQASSQANNEKIEHVTISLDAEGKLYWNDVAITDDALQGKLQSIQTQNPQPELHLRVDKGTRYEKLAHVMAQARTAQIKKIGFVTLPEK